MSKHLLAIVLLLCVGPLARGGEWVKLDGDKLLKPPAGVEGVESAKTPSTVEVYLFEGLPSAPKALWSSWGDGCIASDGKYYTGIGNHLDYDAGMGHSHVYAVGLADKSVKQVIDVRQIVPDTRYAAGKIHARIDQGADGWIYVATYYGKTPEKGSAATKESFIGSVLMRYDPKTAKTEVVGAPVPKQGVPTSITDGQRMLMFGYAAYTGDFFVYDLAKRELKFRGGGEDQAGSRNIMLDQQGRAYFGKSDGTIARYDPATNMVADTKAKLPESKGTGKQARATLRASTAAGKDGVIYGCTHGGTLFAFDPAKETVSELGENWPGGQYTAVMELSPDGRFVYYAPGAHGSSSKIGSPVVQYDVQNKKMKVIAWLNPAAREQMKYNVGGTYNLKISADGATLVGTFNGNSIASGPQKLETFGVPSVVLVRIAKEER